MRKYLVILILPVFFTCCKKQGENIIWERSYGTGQAVTVKTTGDSGFVSVGAEGGNQYLLVTDINGNKKAEYKPATRGVLTGVAVADGYYIACGSRDGKLSVSRIDPSGMLVWDTAFVSTFGVEYVSLCQTGNDSFLAIGSADPDSSVKSLAGLSFISFDGNGSVSNRTDTLYSADSYIAVKGIAADNSGNIYMAITRNGTSGKLKASVTKYNSSLQKLWEKELYNNPVFGAASEAIALDDEANPVIAGRTEMQVSTGIQNNAFVARYFYTGDSTQKSYLEYANSGVSVRGDATGQFMVLNMNCLIVNILDLRMKISGIIRTFRACDSKTTDISGKCLDITSDGNIIMAGSKGSGFYLAVKSSSALSTI